MLIFQWASALYHPLSRLPSNKELSLTEEHFIPPPHTHTLFLCGFMIPLNMVPNLPSCPMFRVRLRRVGSCDIINSSSSSGLAGVDVRCGYWLWNHWPLVCSDSDVWPVSSVWRRILSIGACVNSSHEWLKKLDWARLSDECGSLLVCTRIGC